MAGRMVRWAVNLSEFDVQYGPRGSIKSWIYGNFATELSSEATQIDGSDFQWVLSVDRSFNQQGSSARVILQGPSGLLIE